MRSRSMDLAKPAQLAFRLPIRQAMGREDFLVTECNRAAVSAIDRWPHWRSRVMILVGPEGSGKSHLAGVWSMTANATVISSPELNADSVPELLRAGAVIVEDAPFELDERALFHLINLTKEQRGYLLITSRSYPSQWGVRLPDLLTRLNAAEIAELQAPDDAWLRAVLVKMFSDRQLKISTELLEYLVARMERSGAAARMLVDRIDKVSLERQVPITRALAAAVLQELFPEEDGASPPAWD